MRFQYHLYDLFKLLRFKVASYLLFKIALLITKKGRMQGSKQNLCVLLQQAIIFQFCIKILVFLLIFLSFICYVCVHAEYKLVKSTKELPRQHN